MTNTRLLSFLSDFESALHSDDPSPEGEGRWSAVRTVNYHLGLARLTLAVKQPAGSSEFRGSVLLQSYALADGTPCLKAALSWSGHEGQRGCALFSKPGVDWRGEARKVAAEWMAGPPAPVQAIADYAPAALVAPLAVTA